MRAPVVQQVGAAGEVARVQPLRGVEDRFAQSATVEAEAGGPPAPIGRRFGRPLAEQQRLRCAVANVGQARDPVDVRGDAVPRDVPRGPAAGQVVRERVSFAPRLKSGIPASRNMAAARRIRIVTACRRQCFALPHWQESHFLAATQTPMRSPSMHPSPTFRPRQARYEFSLQARGLRPACDVFGIASSPPVAAAPTIAPRPIRPRNCRRDTPVAACSANLLILSSMHHLS